ncbi:TIGR01459 family HAD-type hydrolase [Limibacillus sp. MBR-115]|jgi:HAD superfamily hydrolase (TIGR01459 family)|uniref:TIGR01459 family HAD-type hydrolase n=1 Tax=Limibacillus sp. MBR-115 TaxID=3156465 RepID=UPI00339536F9
MSEAISNIQGLRELAGRHQGYIVDLWGVLHDGVTAFPAAVEAVRNLKTQGGRILILSNAPRRSSEVAERCRELGIDQSCYHALLSSGEDAWQNLRSRRDPWYARLGRICYHLGPERDHGMRDGLDLDFTHDPVEADFILNTGGHGAEDTVGSYQPIIDACLSQSLPMICANPDLEVIRGGRREICAGAVAGRYEELGGEVRYHGKPHPPIYESAMHLLGLDNPRDVLCIGDSLRTDIAGANASGMGSLWVLDGIHAETLGMTDGRMPQEERMVAICKAHGHTPNFAIPTLRW